MTMLEEQVRRAMRETAAEISPLNVPPLRLPGGSERGTTGPGRLPRGRLAARWPGWLTPLAAAAAVAAVLAATLTLTGGPGRPGHRTRLDALLASAPRYYIVLTNTGPSRGWPRQAEVRATSTGRIVATLTAPRPDNAFIMVAAASGVGRYVLAAQRMALEHRATVGIPVPGGPAAQRRGSVAVQVPAGPIRFYRLLLSSSGQVSALSPLPVPALPAGAVLDGLALTPDGRQLAVATRAGGPRPGPEIQVDTLATGAQRVWTWPGAQPVIESLGGTGSALSWAADDRTLAFSRLIDGRYNVRLLDTTAPGSSLAASRPALSLNWSGRGRRFSHGRAVNNTDTFGALLTPDGSKIVVATLTQSMHPLTSEFAFTEFSARTGKVVAVLGRWWFIRRWPQQEQAVLWTNADGSTLLVLAHRPGVTLSPASPSAGGVFPVAFGVLHGNRFTPVPGAHRLGRLSIFPAW
ncbi:MAG TPA: hypothetical protein VGH77_00020 [Streptosporangiaceae bacterium]